MEENSKDKALSQIIRSLKGHPEYILMIGIGLLGGGMGLGTTAVGLIKENNTLTILGFVSWILLLVVSFLVIMFVKRKTDEKQGPMGPTLGEKAQKAFYAGDSAEILQGRWKAYWYEGLGEDRKVYDPDPQEVIDLMAYKSKVYGVSFDPSTEFTYWMEGRRSPQNTISMIYWSNPDKSVAGLTGVILLDIDTTFQNHGKKMKGWWHGYTRNNQYTVGEVEMEKLGK